MPPAHPQTLTTSPLPSRHLGSHRWVRYLRALHGILPGSCFGAQLHSAPVRETNQSGPPGSLVPRPMPCQMISALKMRPNSTGLPIWARSSVPGASSRSAHRPIRSPPWLPSPRSAIAATLGRFITGHSARAKDRRLGRASSSRSEAGSAAGFLARLGDRFDLADVSLPNVSGLQAPATTTTTAIVPKKIVAEQKIPPRPPRQRNARGPLSAVGNCSER